MPVALAYHSATDLDGIQPPQHDCHCLRVALVLLQVLTDEVLSNGPPTLPGSCQAQRHEIPWKIFHRSKQQLDIIHSGPVIQSAYLRPTRLSRGMLLGLKTNMSIIHARTHQQRASCRGPGRGCFCLWGALQGHPEAGHLPLLAARSPLERK